MLVCTVGDGLVAEKLKIVQEPRIHDVNSEFLYFEKCKPSKQLEYALENQVPFTIWIGGAREQFW